MSVPIRKAVRDAMRAVLSDGTNGFNAKLGTLSGDYGITPFSINWEFDSPNFAQVQMDYENAEVFHAFTEYPVCMLYTTEAVNLPDEGVKYQTFGGQVIVGVEFLLRYRALKDAQHFGNVFTDTNDMESLPDAVEDALFDCVHTQRSALNTSGFRWTRRFTSSRDPVRLTGDGHYQRASFAFEFERHKS